MKRAIASLESIGDYSQSRHYIDPVKGDKETHQDYERRTWRERLHYDSDGIIYIPPMSFKVCIREAAEHLSEKIPGKRGATYTKHFKTILVLKALSTGVHKDSVEGEWVYVPADGKTGMKSAGQRVDKCFPKIRKWSGDVEFLILDEAVTESVFRKTLEEAGKLIGVGRFRPSRNGYYGRFKVNSMRWVEE